MEEFIPFFFFGTIFGITAIVIFTNHKQKMTAIERGIDPAVLFRKPPPRKPEPRKSSSFTLLRFAFAFLGVAIGLLIGNLLDTYTQIEDPICYLSSLFFCIGLSLMIYFFYEKKELEKRNSEETKKPTIT